MKSFEEQLQNYLTDVKESSELNPEANIVNQFNIFLHSAFGLAAKELKIEHRIHMQHIQRRGRMDLLLGHLVVEFKRSDSFESSKRTQLTNYLIEMNRSTDETYVGIFTDGVRFEVWEADGKAPFDTFDLRQLQPDIAYSRLDTYFFSQEHAKPTANDVVARFGASGLLFRQTNAALTRLLEQVKTSPMLETWREQWKKLLSEVYGSDVGNDDLFLRHTYLCQFARLIGFAALERKVPQPAQIEDIITGKAFERFGVNNIGEADFFSWVVRMPEIREEALQVFTRLAEGLAVYELGAIDQDLLKQLYENLVDPQTRHELGEYYTPDWLAELTLREIDYRAPKSLYDPTCGSGAFLFSAIRQLIQQGMRGHALVNFALNNIMGTDIHPLAVTVARMNYLLALAEDLRALGGGQIQTMNVPVFMANALLDAPTPNKPDDIQVETHDGALFVIPDGGQTDQQLTALIDQMELFAEHKPLALEPFAKQLERHFPAVPSAGTQAAWINNLKLLARLKDEDRNGIWAYILKNQARPLVFARRKFDCIVGNPPWLSYRFIQHKAYQKRVKALYKHYGLIESNDNKLFTQMDLSSLFYALVQDRYLQPGGTVAFVMPRAVITGAKQHRAFQQQGFSAVLDLEGVAPLFNVPTCVLIQQGDARHTESIPAVRFDGALPTREFDYARALPLLTRKPATVRFVDSDVRSPHYYERFLNGATLFPRTLCFVRALGFGVVETDPEANKDAKVPYKGVHLSGSVDADYVYATLLSKHLLPFGVHKLHMVALPVRYTDGKLVMMNLKTSEATPHDDFMLEGHFKSLDWFEKANAKWDALKKANSTMTFSERLNYHNDLVKQNPAAPFKVVYNKSGTNLAACVVNVQENIHVHDRRTQGLIMDFVTYFMDTESESEAHYLCAVLNATPVNEAIKAYQSSGTFGERDITRTPFEACAIPPFDAANPLHRQLAALSQSAHDDVYQHYLIMNPSGGQVALRTGARRVAKVQLEQIDGLTVTLLGR